MTVNVYSAARKKRTYTHLCVDAAALCGYKSPEWEETKFADWKTVTCLYCKRLRYAEFVTKINQLDKEY